MAAAVVHALYSADGELLTDTPLFLAFCGDRLVLSVYSRSDDNLNLRHLLEAYQCLLEVQDLPGHHRENAGLHL
jgi:hypothetical protein